MLALGGMEAWVTHKLPSLHTMIGQSMLGQTSVHTCMLDVAMLQCSPVLDMMWPTLALSSRRHTFSWPGRAAGKHMSSPCNCGQAGNNTYNCAFWVEIGQANTISLRSELRPDRQTTSTAMYCFTFAVAAEQERKVTCLKQDHRDREVGSGVTT